MIVSRNKLVIMLMIVLPLTIFIDSGESFAAEELARFSNVQGEVRIRSKYREKGKWLRVKKAGVSLFNGDEIKTLVGNAELTFYDGSLMKISENASLMIEEKSTQRKLFGFVDMSYMNRNVKVFSGKVWADVRKMKGMWTSFESRVAVAGIKGTTVSMYVDSRGDMQFSNKKGEVEITRHDGFFILKLNSGRDVWIRAEERNKTLIQSIKGDMNIITDDVSIQLGDKNAIILGNSGDETNIETADYNGGTVRVLANVATVELDAGEAANFITNNNRNETRIIVPTSSAAHVDVSFAVTSVVLDPGESILIQADERNETATVNVLQSEGGVYIFNEDGRTYNLVAGDVMEIRTWEVTSETVEPQPESLIPPPPVEEGPASPIM